MEEDWDAESSPVTYQNSGDYGYSSSSTFNATGGETRIGRGRGRFTEPSDFKSSNQQYSTDTSNGFGYSDTNSNKGFGNKDYNQTSGFGDTNAYGSGNGFDNNTFDNNTDFSSNNYNDSNTNGSRGGGFGSSKPRGTKYTDGGFGNSGGQSRGSACFKCGQEGHRARECPDAASGGGFGGGSGGFGNSGGQSRGSACFKCGQEGHRARECPDAASEGGFGGGFGNSGSRSRDYGEDGGRGRGRGRGGGGAPGGSTCYKCGNEGHFARECPNQEAGEDNKERPPLYIPPPPPEDEVEMFASMQRGINFGKYDSIPVEVTGVNPPKCIESFEAANLSETIMKNVIKAKYEKPTPVQKYSIPIINAERDLMACAQTGSGKTAAFLLPVLTQMIKNGIESSSFADKQMPQAIVIGPTRELVHQIYLEARKFARSTICRPCEAYGGASVGHQLDDIQRGCNMLLATPGRLMDFIKRGKIGLDKVQFLILDEADRMLDMGFEKEIRRLVDSVGMPMKTDRHTLMFSATFPDEIQKLAHDFLREDFLFLTVGRVGGACTDVTQSIVQIDHDDKRTKLLDLISDVAETRARTLVFVETKRSADFLACSLSQADYPTTSIHGDRLQREREEALRDFKKGTHPILIATSVAARGLDIPKVEHVINYDLPKDIDEYVHRIGRTGRCGNLGRATSFYDNSKDSQMARSLVTVLSESMQEVPSWLEGCAQSAVGTSFGADGGGFGGRDARSGGGRGRGRSNNQGFGGEPGGDFGSRATGDFDYNDGGGFGGGGFGAADAEESWD